MDNHIKKEALKVLANAPAIAAKTFITSLKSDDEKKQAITLFKALKIIKQDN